MSRYSRQSFFFQQKRHHRTRRVRKPLDTQSILAEKREPVLTFYPQVKEGETDLPYKSPGRHRRPSSGASRLSSVRLPPVDTTGPHLTTGASSQIPTELNDRKQSILKSIDVVEPEEYTPHQPNYKFNEIKIASTAILFNLSRRFEGFTSSSELSLPETLVNILVQSFNSLVADSVLEKREWQTDCYLDYKPNKRRSFLTESSEEGDKIKLLSSLTQLVKQEREILKQKPNMSGKKLERPLTAKSTASGVSIKSDVSYGSSHDVEYDKLPPELRVTQGPQILRYRRESQTPRRKLSVPKTRLEKFKDMKSKYGSGREKKRVPLLLKAKSIDVTDKEETEIKIHTGVSSSTINFSLSDKTCADQGWIIHPSQAQDPEGYTLSQWASSRLQEAMRQREESRLTAKLRGEDGPLIVRYYSDNYSRSFRGTRQKTSSLPLPAILSKLPPSLATFSSPGQQENILINEGLQLCLLQLPDSSGFCNYYSGRRAVSFSRKGDGSRGLYCIVYDDSESNNIIAYFMPTGHTACYHKNGGLHMLTDPTGGLLLDEDGFEIREWQWPPIMERMNHTVFIQLNTHLALQCTGRTQMTLKFSCHGQMHRFPVGLIPETIAQEDKNESFWMKRTDVISDTLQTCYNFQSHASRGLTEVWTNKPSSHESRESNRMNGVDDILSISHKWDSDVINKELEDYKNKMRSIVNEWLGHYRQIIGITPPSRQGLQSFGSNTRLMSSIGIKSRQGSRPPTQASTRPSSHLLTYPIPSSSPRPITPFSTISSPPSPVEDIPLSSLNNFIERPKSQEHPHPFKVGPAKPRPRPPQQFRPGCPVALHQLLVKNLSEMPKCKCDRRHLSLIRDVEFDVFMKTQVPSNQLIIIYIIESGRPHSSCEPLLESLHFGRNRNRYAPCQQSCNDPFRLLKYDISLALNDLTSSLKPLLIQRHHITTGMFLMYMGNRLIGCTNNFNGYGLTKRDFLKQIQHSLDSGRKGHFLPSDFKFSSFSFSGVKIHSHSLWAYPISGVLDELVSHTPSSTTSQTSSMSSVDCHSSVGVLCNTSLSVSKLVFKRED